MRSRLSALAALVALFAIANADCAAAPERREREESPRPPPPAMPRPSFLVGYNEGWFGANYGSDLTSNYDRATVAKTLDGMASAGGRVVRIWLFEGREGIELGTGAPRTRGLSPAFLEHLGETLDAARARGLWVYLTALEGNEMPAEPGPLRDYFSDLLNDERGEGQSFREHVLAPLLAMLGQRRDVIYGLDLMNEIEAPRSRGFWREPAGGSRAFIQRTTAFIKTRAAWLRVTSSAGWDEGAADVASGSFSGLGLDFYDVHVYSDAGTYPAAMDVCARAKRDGVPVILGEFGQKTRASDDALHAAATQSFLENAKKLCFTGALAWRYDAAERWWNFAQPDGSFRPAVKVMQEFSANP